MIQDTRKKAPSKAATEVVRLGDVYKTYHRGAQATPVLKGVNLQVNAQECVFLAGPSGSGKSTLLSILGCILSPDRGRVEVFAKDISQLDSAQRTVLRRDRIGFVFQRFQLIKGLSALENVALPLTLREVSRSEKHRRAVSLLEAVGLADKVHARPSHLSSGQCQRVALARALAGEPRLVLADEPTASLDEDSGIQVMRLLKELTQREGAAAVVVTHDPRIFKFADRVCYMDKGRLTERGEKANEQSSPSNVHS